MILSIVSLVAEFLGTLLIAYTALLVHHRVRVEMRIDMKVLKQMRIEMALGVIGIVLITLGFILRLVMLYG